MSEAIQNATGGQKTLEGLELEPPRLSRRSLAIRLSLAAAAVAVLVWSYIGAEVRPMDLHKYGGNMLEYASGFMDPDFSYWKEILREMIVTVQIAIWGTFLAVVLAVPFGLMCSSNISPLWLYQPARRVMDAARAINEMIFAMFFISAVGLGPFAGALALFVHTLGVLAKLFSECVEAIDPMPVEGIRASGGNLMEEVNFGIIPQVMPHWISYSLYRFESNVRSASVVGMVGAGGIGFIIWDAIRSFNYGKTAAIILVIVITVTILDFFSGELRKRFI
jgi:phosphonate transport system permease protein